MKEQPLTVEFRLPPTKTSPAAKPLAGEKAERLRQDRAARRAKNLALAYYIDGLICSRRIEDSAAAAGLCGVSRARLSSLISLLATSVALQEQVLLGAKAISRPRLP